MAAVMVAVVGAVAAVVMVAVAVAAAVVAAGMADSARSRHVPQETFNIQHSTPNFSNCPNCRPLALGCWELNVEC